MADLRFGLVGLLAAGLAASAAPAAEIRFRDVTAEAGLVYRQHAPRRPPECPLDALCEAERMSGGAAAGDVDGDGLVDLLVTRLDAPDILFLNSGHGRFVDATARSGLSEFDLRSNGATFADIDNDGDLDLYLTVIGRREDPVNRRNHLFVNDGTGAFTEQAVARGADLGDDRHRAGYSATFGDYDRDGWLDLHVNDWLGSSSRTRLLRNLGPGRPGHFADVTEAAGLDFRSVYAFASAFADLDDDGWPDLVVAADFGTSLLFWNEADGTFTDGTRAAGVGTDENGMGSTLGDFDGDGDPDWFVTSIFDESSCRPRGCNWGQSGNRLYRNEGGRRFSDATDQADVRRGGWGWGTALFDPDNDGDLDLVMTNGVDFPESDLERAFERDPMRMWRNDGAGPMHEISASAGLHDRRSGKGLLVFDYDVDGDLDLFIVNNADGPVLYRNEAGNANDWLRVVTVGTVSNRQGLGARVTVRVRPRGAVSTRWIGSVSHFLGQGERAAHFGLGPPAEAPGRGRVASVRIDWPAGGTQEILDVPRNVTLVVTEPSPTEPGRVRMLRRGPGVAGGSRRETRAPAGGAVVPIR